MELDGKLKCKSCNNLDSFFDLEAYKTHCNTQDHIACWHLYKLDQEQNHIIALHDPFGKGLSYEKLLELKPRTYGGYCYTCSLAFLSRA